MPLYIPISVKFFLLKNLRKDFTKSNCVPSYHCQTLAAKKLVFMNMSRQYSNKSFFGSVG